MFESGSCRTMKLASTSAPSWSSIRPAAVVVARSAGDHDGGGPRRGDDLDLQRQPVVQADRGEAMRPGPDDPDSQMAGPRRGVLAQECAEVAAPLRIGRVHHQVRRAAPRGGLTPGTQPRGRRRLRARRPSRPVADRTASISWAASRTPRRTRTNRADRRSQGPGDRIGDERFGVAVEGLGEKPGYGPGG